MRWRLVQAGPTVRASSSGQATAFRLRGYARGRPAILALAHRAPTTPSPTHFDLV